MSFQVLSLLDKRLHPTTY